MALEVYQGNSQATQSWGRVAGRQELSQRLFSIVPPYCVVTGFKWQLCHLQYEYGINT